MEWSAVWLSGKFTETDPENHPNLWKLIFHQKWQGPTVNTYCRVIPNIISDYFKRGLRWVSRTLASLNAGFERTKWQWWGQFSKGPDGTPNSCLMDAYSPYMVVTGLDPAGWKNNCRSSMNHQGKCGIANLRIAMTWRCFIVAKIVRLFRIWMNQSGGGNKHIFLPTAITITDNTQMVKIG